MGPLKYHHGQLSIQEEAKTQYVAEKLAHWVGPVAEFACDADLFLFASLDETGRLKFATLAGPPPLLEVAEDDELTLRFPAAFSSRLPDGRCGGLAISLALARRARLNGTVSHANGAVEMKASETFTLCRKYMAPSISLAEAPMAGPQSRASISVDDPWLADLMQRSETAFLASVSPDGGPDVAHRGGPPGFITVDPLNGSVSWPEYVGDGVFKSAGNVRATGKFTLLVPDPVSGDGLELVGSAGYTNTRSRTRQRLDPLVQHKEPFPAQGFIEGKLLEAFRLEKVIHPRQRIEKAQRITSCSTVPEQAPQ